MFVSNFQNSENFTEKTLFFEFLKRFSFYIVSYYIPYCLNFLKYNLFFKVLYFEIQYFSNKHKQWYPVRTL